MMSPLTIGRGFSFEGQRFVAFERWLWLFMVTRLHLHLHNSDNENENENLRIRVHVRPQLWSPVADGVSPDLCQGRTPPRLTQACRWNPRVDPAWWRTGFRIRRYSTGAWNRQTWRLTRGWHGPPRWYNAPAVASWNLYKFQAHMDHRERRIYSVFPYSFSEFSKSVGKVKFPDAQIANGVLYALGFVKRNCIFLFYITWRFTWVFLFEETIFSQKSVRVL